MGCHHAVVESPQRAVGGQRLDGCDIESGAADPSLGQCTLQGRSVDDLATGHVQQDCAVGHQGEHLVVEHGPGVIGERQAHRQDVAGGHDVAQRLRPADGFDAFAGRNRVEVHRLHVHAERGRASGEMSARAAESQNAHGQAFELEFAVTHLFPEVVVPSLGTELHRRCDAPDQRQQQAERMIRQVAADQTLLAGQHDIAGEELGVHEHVDA